MADLKISQLTGATTPLAGTEVLPIVQGGATKQVSVANLTAGRTQTSNGIVQGTAGTGYNFTANTPAAGMTSQLLNWYEEGTWTPGQGSGLTVVGTFSASGKYTRVGRLVTVTAELNATTSITASAGNAVCTGLPFAVSGAHVGSLTTNALSQSSSASAYGTSLYSSSATTSATGLVVTVTYMV